MIIYKTTSSYIAPRSYITRGDGVSLNFYIIQSCESYLNGGYPIYTYTTYLSHEQLNRITKLVEWYKS